MRICFTDDGDELPAAVDLPAVSMPDPTAENGRGLALAQAVLEQLAKLGACCADSAVDNQPRRRAPSVPKEYRFEEASNV